MIAGILGGLVTSTFCRFLIHPGLFQAFSGKDAERLVKAEHAEEDELHDPPLTHQGLFDSVGD